MGRLEKNYEKIKVVEVLNDMEKFLDCGILYTSGLLKSDKDILISYDEYNTNDIDDFHWTLEMKDIEDILSNLSQQVSHPTIEQKIEAINYYIENDAFIDLEGT